MSCGEEVISRESLKELLEYSCTLPTGQTIGKRWRRATCGHPAETAEKRENSEWKIGTYIEHPDPGLVGIEWVWAVSEPGTPHRGQL